MDKISDENIRLKFSNNSVETVHDTKVKETTEFEIMYRDAFFFQLSSNRTMPPNAADTILVVALKLRKNPKELCFRTSNFETTYEMKYLPFFLHIYSSQNTPGTRVRGL